MRNCWSPHHDLHVLNVRWAQEKGALWKLMMRTAGLAGSVAALVRAAAAAVGLPPAAQTPRRACNATGWCVSVQLENLCLGKNCILTLPGMSQVVVYVWPLAGYGTPSAVTCSCRTPLNARSMLPVPRSRAGRA